MSAHPDLDRRVTDWLRAEAPPPAPDSVLSAALDRVAVLGQERTLNPWGYSGSRDQRGMGRIAMIAATAALMALIAAGVVLVGSQLRTNDAPLPVQPPAPVGRVPGQGPTLSWTRVDVIPLPGPGFDRTATRVVWLGDRFVMVDEDTRTVATSPDGTTWTTLSTDDPDWDYFGVITSHGSFASWEDAIVGWTRDALEAGVRIRRSPAAPVVESDFEGTVDAVGIGGVGIVVKSQTEFDQDGFFRRVLGPGWGPDEIETIGLQDGVVSISTRDGRTTDVNLAEHGIDEWEFANRGEGWYSVDGTAWAAIPDFPPNVFAIVGTVDGFFARGHDGEGMGMWHSTDGVSWQRVWTGFDMTSVWQGDPALMRWGGSVLHSDGIHLFERWTPTGRSVLPMSDEIPPDRDVPIGTGAFGAGPLGIVSLDIDGREVLFTPDGVVWRIQEIPQEMARAGQPTRNAFRTNVAVGTDAVVVLLWEGSADEGQRPSLWVGTPGP